MGLSRGFAAELAIFARRLGVNSFWLTLSRLGSQALSALTIILVARALGPAGLGGFTFIASLILVGNVFTTFGLDTLLVREVARSREPRSPLLPAALWLQLGLSGAFISALLLVGDRIPHQTPGTLLALQLYSLALLPLAFYTVYSAVLRAYERMDLFLLINLLVAAVQMVGAWQVLRFGGDLISLALILLASQILGALAAGWLGSRAVPNLRLNMQPPLQMINLTKEVLRQSWPLAVLGGLAVISQRLGVLVLALIAGQSMTGAFSAAARLVELLKLGHYAYFGALFPVLAAQAAGSRPDKPAVQPAISKRLVRAFFAALLLLSLAAAIIMNWLAGPLVELLYGPGYASSAGLLKLLAWSLVPYTVTAQLSLEMVANRQERYVVISSASSISLAALAYVTLVPRLGLNGAGLAVITGEAAAAILLVWFSHQMGRRITAGSQLSKSFKRRDEIRHEILSR